MSQFQFQLTGYIHWAPTMNVTMSRPSGKRNVSAGVSILERPREESSESRHTGKQYPM